MPIMPSMPRTASELDSGYHGGPNTTPAHKPDRIAPAPDTSPKPPKEPARKAPASGVRSKENGGMVYRTGGCIWASAMLNHLMGAPLTDDQGPGPDTPGQPGGRARGIQPKEW